MAVISAMTGTTGKYHPLCVCVCGENQCVQRHAREYGDNWPLHCVVVRTSVCVCVCVCSVCLYLIEMSVWLMPVWDYLSEESTD